MYCRVLREPGTCVFGVGVGSEQLDGDLGQHPLHPEADLPAGAPYTAGLLLQGHRVGERRVITRWNRVTLGGTTQRWVHSRRVIITT